MVRGDAEYSIYAYVVVHAASAAGALSGKIRVAAASAMPDGCGAGEANIALYHGSVSLPLPTDVRAVLVNNREASATTHLPAFTSCR